MTVLLRRIFVISAFALLMQAAPAWAAGCIKSIDRTIDFSEGAFNGPVDRFADYIAVIAPRDLVNSKGIRLPDYRAVVQQDRANFHKTGQADKFGEITDQTDPIFKSAKMRRLLSQGDFYFYCWQSPGGIAALQKSIAAGEVQGVLRVVVFRHPGGRLAIFLSLVG